MDDFVGQSACVDNLRIFIGAAKARGEPLDHVLLHGPPGLGKTSLARIIAKEMGAQLRQTSGPVLAKPGDLAAILSSLDVNDVLFVDEIHRLNPVVEEQLYPALEDRALDVLIGEGPGARSVRIELNPFTLVSATTRLGLISAPLRSRFGIVARLEYYGVAELAAVVGRTAAHLGRAIEPEAAVEVGRRARGTPRIAGRLLRRVADFASDMGQEKISLDAAKTALSRMGVDEDGLDGADRRYLELLASAYEGGPAGIDTIAAALSETRDALEDVTEPYLLQKGFIARSPRGRLLTRRGWEKCGRSFPEKDASAAA